MRVDVIQRIDAHAASQTITREYEPVTVLVNSAGVLTMTRFPNLTERECRDAFDVNVYGTYLEGHGFGRSMAMGGDDELSTVAGKVALTDRARYYASKAGAIVLTRVMTLELARRTGRVFTVCPGAGDTDMFNHCLSWTPYRDAKDRDEPLKEWFVPSKLRRIIKAVEVAALVLCPARGPVDALTGHALSCDGGAAPW